MSFYFLRKPCRQQWIYWSAIIILLLSCNTINFGFQRLKRIFLPIPSENQIGVKTYWPFLSGQMGNHVFQVNLSNGNMIVFSMDHETPALGIDRIISRSYNSFSTNSGDFGVGWTSNVGNSTHLVFLPNGHIHYY